MSVLSLKTKPRKPRQQKHDAESIRNELYRALNRSEGPLAAAVAEAKAKVLLHFAESMKLHREAYDTYAANRRKRIEEDRQARQHAGNYGGWRFGYGSYHDHIDPYHAIREDDFVVSFLLASYANCSFMKRPDGTRGRKFWWSYSSESCGYYWNDWTSTVSYALQGLSFVVITDATDENILGLEVCESRAKK